GNAHLAQEPFEASDDLAKAPPSSKARQSEDDEGDPETREQVQELKETFDPSSHPPPGESGAALPAGHSRTVWPRGAVLPDFGSRVTRSASGRNATAPSCATMRAFPSTSGRAVPRETHAPSCSSHAWYTKPLAGTVR